VSFDAPELSGRVLADCRRYVPFALVAIDPTCPECQQELIKTIEDVFGS